LIAGPCRLIGPSLIETGGSIKTASRLVFAMSIWSDCFLVVRGAGWFLLRDVPESASAAAAARLTQLGAQSVSVPEPGAIRFRATLETVAPLVARLSAAFPSCPWPRPGR
jgi:hypothetical protein